MSKLRRDVNKLLRGIQNGNERDKVRLYELTYNHLKIIARIYLKNQNDVEDVVQETYLRVYRYIASFNWEKDGYNWLCRIVQRKAYGRVAAQRRLCSLEACALQPDPMDMTEMVSAKDEIYRYLKGYSDLDCRLIYLRYYKDYTFEKIAEIMNMKKSNVHRRISKVVKEIQAKRKAREEKMKNDD